MWPATLDFKSVSIPNFQMQNRDRNAWFQIRDNFKLSDAELGAENARLQIREKFHLEEAGLDPAMLGFEPAVISNPRIAGIQ